MKHILILTLVWVLLLSSFSESIAQKNHAVVAFDSLFELQLHSIEREVVRHHRTNDTTLFLHYSIKNVSKDTLTYVTNSCFYHNHYCLIIENNEFDINRCGGCYFNETTPHRIAPDESFSVVEWVADETFENILPGQYDMQLSVPLRHTQENYFIVDGTLGTEADGLINFHGNTKLNESLFSRNIFGKI